MPAWKKRCVGVNWDYICLLVLMCVCVRLHTFMFKMMWCAREITQTHIIIVCNSYHYSVPLLVFVCVCALVYA